MRAVRQGLAVVSDPADHAKRLAEIEALAAIAATSPWTAWRLVRDHLPWLLAEQRAASEALTAAGIPDDGRSLAERVKQIAHDASYGASYRESWERLQKSKDADDIARAQVTHDLDILRRAAIATAVSLGEVLPEDAGPETIAASLRRGVGRAKPAAPEERCSTCGEPYTVPPTRRAVVCSNGFHLCRDCTWSKGRRTERCDRHATPEMERAEILAAGDAELTPRTIEATLPDLGITVAHGATAQELAEDVASQVLYVVAEYALAAPAHLAPDAIALRGRVRARLGLDAAGSEPPTGLGASAEGEHTAGPGEQIAEAPACRHEATAYGPNMPLRHGSARTKVCAGCGAYKLVTWHDKDYSGWRSADVHADVATAEAESEEL